MLWVKNELPAVVSTAWACEKLASEERWLVTGKSSWSVSRRLTRASCSVWRLACSAVRMAEHLKRCQSDPWGNVRIFQRAIAHVYFWRRGYFLHWDIYVNLWPKSPRLMSIVFLVSAHLETDHVTMWIMNSLDSSQKAGILCIVDVCCGLSLMIGSRRAICMSCTRELSRTDSGGVRRKTGIG